MSKHLSKMAGRNCLLEGKNLRVDHDSRWPPAFTDWVEWSKPLNVSFIRKESFKLMLKWRMGVCLLDQEWKMIPKERSLVTEESGSHSTSGELDQNLPYILGPGEVEILIGYSINELLGGLCKWVEGFSRQNIQHFKWANESLEILQGTLKSVSPLCTILTNQMSLTVPIKPVD